MLIVGGMTSVSGAVVGVFFITFVNELFRRWEVEGAMGVQPPSGTASLVLAFVLLVTLILRPKGITGGKEIPWPGDWRVRGWLRRPSAAVAGAPGEAGSAAAEGPASAEESRAETTSNRGPTAEALPKE
jgi:branched-chain amino acid transport system permease protein